MTKVLRMDEGQAFGELALRSNNKKQSKRSATIICEDDVHLAFLEKKDYNRVIGESMEKKLNEQVDFIKNFRLSEGITKNTLVKLIYYFKEKTYRRRDIVFKENDDSDGMYFIKEG